jgi:arabinoxylan arabinofuranohydrolase
MDLLIDPCVFINDDERAYIYNGGGGICMKDNMMELDSKMLSIEGLEDFHEANLVHKYKYRYYLSLFDNYDDNWNDD